MIWTEEKQDTCCCLNLQEAWAEALAGEVDLAWAEELE